MNKLNKPLKEGKFKDSIIIIGFILCLIAWTIMFMLYGVSVVVFKITTPFQSLIQRLRDKYKKEYAKVEYYNKPKDF